MTKEIQIPLRLIDDSKFKPYGSVLWRGKNRSPDLLGEGWECWYPVGELMSERGYEAGLVYSHPRSLVLSEMERHLDQEELVFALDEPFIQAVALSTNEQHVKPDPETAKAFLVYPGEGLLIAPGVWHAAGLPGGNKSAMYGFVLEKPSGD